MIKQIGYVTSKAAYQLKKKHVLILEIIRKM